VLVLRIDLEGAFELATCAHDEPRVSIDEAEDQMEVRATGRLRHRVFRKARRFMEIELRASQIRSGVRGGCGVVTRIERASEKLCGGGPVLIVLLGSPPQDAFVGEARAMKAICFREDLRIVRRRHRGAVVARGLRHVPKLRCGSRGGEVHRGSQVGVGVLARYFVRVRVRVRARACDRHPRDRVGHRSPWQAPLSRVGYVSQFRERKAALLDGQ
jgi:hypothetical protein